MPGRFVVFIVAAVLLPVGLSRPALALWVPPWCFKIAPFTDVLIFYPKTTGGAQRQGSGRDTQGERAVLVSAYLQGGDLQLGFTILPKAGFVPVFGGGTINPNTGVGSGQCFAPTLADCGNFTFQLVDCATATAAATASVAPSAKVRVMGARPAVP